MKKTDLVVIAAGPAGLASAIQAAEDGAKVIVVEKTSNVGGAANMGMGPLGIGTKYQKAGMIDITVEKAFNMFMDYTHYMVDARLVKRYFAQSAETIEWLEDMGVEFEGTYKYFPKSEATWHIVKSESGIGPRAASFMVKAMHKKALDLGVEFLLETPAKKIVLKDGKVAGVLVTDNTGAEFEIECKAAVICTGGAGANPEMIKQETGFTYGENMFNFAIPGLVGDGIKMAWEAGGAKVPVRIESAALMLGTLELPQSVVNVFSQPNLLVNKLGKRVMNEDHMQNTTFLSNVCSKQKDYVCYSILDSSIVKDYMRNGLDTANLVRTNPDVSDFAKSVEKAVEGGNKEFFIADTIEELAEKAGIDVDALVETVDNYNEYCDTRDEEFFKDHRYMRELRKGPFYAGKFHPAGYGTVGGIKINENCEVINDAFDVIPGLYSAGSDACNIYDDSYMFLLPGNSMGFAVNTGRIAGMTAAEYIEE